MPGRAFIRWFTNNNEYGKFERTPYMDALAHVVEEYVYSDKLDTSWDSFNMVEEIRMFDFMTLVVFFINESYQEFGKTTIRGFMEDLKIRYKGRNNTHVEYPDGNLFVTDASSELIMDLLWTTYIYASARYELGKNEKWADTASMVYGVMFEESGLNKESFLEAPFSKTADSARKMMLTFMLRKEWRNRQKKEAPKESPTAKDSEKDACIAELEAELKKAKADIEAYESQGKGVRASMHALLITTLCQHHGGLPQNGRQSLSPILQKLYGYTESSSESAFKHRFTQKDADELAKIFNTTSPKVASLIKEMPQLLKQQNNERLRKLRENK